MSDILVPHPPESAAAQAIYEDTMPRADQILSATERGSFWCENHGEVGKYWIMWYLGDAQRECWRNQKCHECGKTLQIRPKAMVGNA